MNPIPIAAKMVARSLLLGLPLMLCLSSARGACLHWAEQLGKPDESVSYGGYLGSHPIRMMLHLDVATGRFDGAYGYYDRPGVLKLVGCMRADGIGADLEELNAQGRVTGVFSLAFFWPHVYPYSGSGWGNHLDFYEKHIRNQPSGCSALTGVWQTEPWDKKPPGQLVILASGPTIDPANNRARLENEATAYKFVQALQHNDRKKVASLLHYPLHSGFNKTWETPASVLKNYDKIMSFIKVFVTNDQVKSLAVPHFLITSNSGVTGFMNGSVYLYDGKITWICAGRCPVMSDSELMGQIRRPTLRVVTLPQ